MAKRLFFPFIAVTLILSQLITSTTRADDTTTVCEDDIGEAGGFYTSVSGCFIPEERFQAPKDPADPSGEWVPDDEVLNINPDCMIFEDDPNIFEEWRKTGFEERSLEQCNLDDYLDDFMDFCTDLIDLGYTDINGQPIATDIDPEMPYMPAHYYDSSLTPGTAANSATLASEQGQKYQRQRCLELYVMEYAHRADCGEILLARKDEKKFFSIEQCQMVQIPKFRTTGNNSQDMLDDLRTEVFDAHNFYKGSDVTYGPDICGNVTLDSSLGAFQAGNKFNFSKRTCKKFDKYNSAFAPFCGGGLNELQQSVRGTGHWFQYDTRNSWGWFNAPMHHITNPQQDGNNATLYRHKGENADPINARIKSKESSETTGTSGVKKSNFQMPLGWLGDDIDNYYEHTFPDALKSTGPPRLESEEDVRIAIERIRDTCHPFALRDSLDHPYDPFGSSLANFFGYTSRCNKWIDHKDRKHEDIQITNHRLSRFDDRWRKAFFGVSFPTGPQYPTTVSSFQNTAVNGCADFSCNCKSWDPNQPIDDDNYPTMFRNCVVMKIMPRYTKWLECFYNARYMACPIAERDISPWVTPGGTIPEDADIGGYDSRQFEPALMDDNGKYLRWEYEEPNTLAMLPLAKLSDLSFGTSFEDTPTAPFMAPVIPFPTATKDGLGGYYDLADQRASYQQTYNAARNSFESRNPGARVNESIVGPRGCDIGGWYEMLLYQARCIKMFGLNCICDYHKTFVEGSAEKYVLERSGTKFDTVRPENSSSGSGSSSGSSTGGGKYETNTMKWPLEWRGYAGPDYAPNAFPTSKLWLDPNVKSDATEKGLGCAQEGDFVIIDETVTLAHPDPADPESCQNLSGLEKERRCIGNEPRDARLPRHIFYVEATGFEHYNAGDLNYMSGIITDPSDITQTQAPESRPIDPDPDYDPADPCKLKSGANNRYVILTSKNWGKNWDACGNTDRWHKVTSTMMYHPDPANVPERIRGKKCADPDNVVCVADWWRTAKIYRPSRDVKLPLLGADHPDPGADSRGAFTAYSCEGPEKIKDGVYTGNYLEDDLRTALDQRIGTCEPPLELRGTKVGSKFIAHLRPSAILETEKGTNKQKDVTPAQSKTQDSPHHPPIGFGPSGPAIAQPGPGNPGNPGASGSSSGVSGNPGTSGSSSIGGGHSAGGTPGSSGLGGTSSTGSGPPVCVSCVRKAGHEFWRVHGATTPAQSCSQNPAPCIAADQAYALCAANCSPGDTSCADGPFKRPPPDPACCLPGETPAPHANCP